MEIATKYQAQEVEKKWYQYWLDNGFFKSIPDEREAYTIVIPPPNVTGVLHMGHMLNNTIQDILVRRARMIGKNACWVPGTDHASIATEAKVVAKLKAEGIDKNTLTREQFLEHAWEWKEKHGGIILEQLKKLGASCDWDRTKFTMDPEMTESVIKVFVDLYNKGLIYRGIRMINWDSQALTAVSDEEVIYKEVQSKLYYLRYKIVGEENYVTIATTRPETILGDTAICINPNDTRFTHLKNKKVIVPLVNREVPIIFDEYVDMEFGTGALKITPAHDINDYEIGIKHRLESINIFNDDGTLSEKAELFIGIDRFEVRKAIIPELEKSGNLVKIEDYVNKVGFSERTDSVIEPKLSMQWFLKMEDLAKPALEVVMSDSIQLVPAKFKNTYRHWMENVRDWNISRQLWWGQRIPAYYLPDGTFVVAENDEKAVELAKIASGNNLLTINDLVQDEDVLDTWFSSWLWPVSVFDGIRNPDNNEIKYYYPTNDLITAPEILFFWVARMIIAGQEYQGEKPFNNVYLTGIVRDKLGRKMSKSLGNSPDPLDLIAKYGADGVRVGMMLCSPAGNDLMFDEALTEQGRNFSNKIWNAFRLVKSWEVDLSIDQPEHSKKAIQWMTSKMDEVIAQLDDQFEKFRISDALMSVYKLFWDEFSSWYLEIIKPEYQKPIDAETIKATNLIFDKLLRILHPFMPFLTEELWQLLEERKDGESIMITSMPKIGEVDASILNSFEFAKQVITELRTIRKEKNISMREGLVLKVLNNPFEFPLQKEVISKISNLSGVEMVEQPVEGALSFMVSTNEFYVPMGDNLDVEAEIIKIDEEIKYLQGFLVSVEKKLSNDKFVNNAPAQVVEVERKKHQDAKEKIASLLKQKETLV
ncbi:MAG: valine--tRNA ligase [Bacteroidales bacterium]|nr:valine--tRNA ligase [Bacteroidales bacterium]